MRWFGFMFAFLVMALANGMPTPFIFDSACVSVRVPSRSVPAMRSMCWNSRLVVVDMFGSHGAFFVIGLSCEGRVFYLNL